RKCCTRRVVARTCSECWPEPRRGRPSNHEQDDERAARLQRLRALVSHPGVGLAPERLLQLSARGGAAEPAQRPGRMAPYQGLTIIEGDSQRGHRAAIRDVAERDTNIAQQTRPSPPPDRAVAKAGAEAVVVA